MRRVLRVIRERCACGAEFETTERDPLSSVTDWRSSHRCPDRLSDDFAPIGGTAQVEQAPDYIEPELHIGFRF